MFIGSYTNSGEKIIKLLCQTYGLTCESTICGSHDFKTCKRLRVTMRLLENGLLVKRIHVPSYETQSASVETNTLDQMCIAPSKYRNDYFTTSYKIKLSSKSYNGQVKEITCLCYNKLAEMLVGHTIEINGSSVNIPEASSVEEFKLKLMISQ